MFVCMYMNVYEYVYIRRFAFWQLRGRFVKESEFVLAVLVCSLCSTYVAWSYICILCVCVCVLYLRRLVIHMYIYCVCVCVCVCMSLCANTFHETPAVTRRVLVLCHSGVSRLLLGYARFTTEAACAPYLAAVLTFATCVCFVF